MTYEEYQTYFAGKADEKICGEISPCYFILPAALLEIKKHNPQCKILSGLRNPFERLFSQYKYHKKQHGFKSFDLFVNNARQEFDLN